MIVAGLDLAWSRDFTASAVISDNDGLTRVLALDRWKPAREDLADVPLRLEAALNLYRPLALGWDGTGIGRDFGRILKTSPHVPRDIGLFPLVISAGWKPARQRWDREGAVFVAKGGLVRALFRRLEERTLRVPALLLAGVLKAELASYEPKELPDGRRTWGAKAGCHDDLVSALAMACWLADAIRNRGAGGIRPVNFQEGAWLPASSPNPAPSSSPSPQPKARPGWSSAAMRLRGGAGRASS